MEDFEDFEGQDAARPLADVVEEMDREVVRLENEVSRLEAERQRLREDLAYMRSTCQLNAQVMSVVDHMVEELSD